MEMAKDGVVEVVYEMVEGSRMVVSTIAISIMVIAAVAMVRTGYYLFGILVDRTLPYCGKRHRPDHYVTR